jgi:hypothetical protein
MPPDLPCMRGPARQAYHPLETEVAWAIREAVATSVKACHLLVTEVALARAGTAPWQGPMRA